MGRRDMSVFAISDLHLALGINKPMDIFGERWTDYMSRIENNWRNTVTSGDLVLVPGDISWATYLEESYRDFSLIHRLPGIKIISKGNHDYWWTTAAKLKKFTEENGFDSILFLHNNSYNMNGISICGTRGWKNPGDEDFTDADLKIYYRELSRLEISLKSAKSYPPGTLVVAMHYPPFNANGEPTEFVSLMKAYGVDICIYGHLHGEAVKKAVTGNIDGIDFYLVSSDYLKFSPERII